MKSPDRLMQFSISERDVLHIALPDDCWRRVVDVNLPDDVTILSVHYNHLRRQFEFLISSESFERIAPGGIPPPLNLNIEFKQLPVTKEESE